jgi:hypothetical protein
VARHAEARAARASPRKRGSAQKVDQRKKKKKRGRCKNKSEDTSRDSSPSSRDQTPPTHTPDSLQSSPASQRAQMRPHEIVPLRGEARAEAIVGAACHQKWELVFLKEGRLGRARFRLYARRGLVSKPRSWIMTHVNALMDAHCDWQSFTHDATGLLHLEEYLDSSARVTSKSCKRGQVRTGLLLGPEFAPNGVLGVFRNELRKYGSHTFWLPESAAQAMEVLRLLHEAAFAENVRKNNWEGVGVHRDAHEKKRQWYIMRAKHLYLQGTVPEEESVNGVVLAPEEERAVEDLRAVLSQVIGRTVTGMPSFACQYHKMTQQPYHRDTMNQIVVLVVLLSRSSAQGTQVLQVEGGWPDLRTRDKDKAMDGGFWSKAWNSAASEVAFVGTHPGCPELRPGMAQIIDGSCIHRAPPPPAEGQPPRRTLIWALNCARTHTQQQSLFARDWTKQFLPSD